jgi:hypothetical protein
MSEILGFIGSIRLDVWDKAVNLTLDPATHIAHVNSIEPDHFVDGELDDVLGICTFMPAQKPIVVGWFDGQIATLVHECLHVTTALLEDRGVPITRENDETMAYTLDCVFRKLLQSMKETPA